MRIYNATASHDEIRRFKMSAAGALTKQEQNIRLEKEYELIESVSDNFDIKWIKINSISCYYDNSEWHN